MPQELFPSPGEYDHGFDTVHTFFDPASIGVHVDGGQLSSVLVGQTKGIRTLLAYDFKLNSESSESLMKDPERLAGDLIRSKERLQDKFFPIK